MISIESKLKSIKNKYSKKLLRGAQKNGQLLSRLKLFGGGPHTNQSTTLLWLEVETSWERRWEAPGGCAWFSQWNCLCSVTRLFLDILKTTSTTEQFAHGCKFLWIIAAQFGSAPHPLPDPLLQFWGVRRQVTSAFFWKLPWEASTSAISNLNQWSVFHWSWTILWAPYELWKHILYADDSLENKELSKLSQLWTMHEHHQHRST